MGIDVTGATIWASTLAAGLIGAWFGRWLERQDKRRDRLRELYSEAMRAALMWTPPDLGKRAPGPDVQPDPHDVDLLLGRLMVEAHRDEDEVVKALLGVQGTTTLYRMDRNNRDRGEDVLEEEIRKDRQAVYDALTELQSSVRRRLK